MAMQVIRLAPSQKKQAARVYTRAFFDYPMLVFYFPDRKRRERYLEWYLGCAITYALRYGEVYNHPGRQRAGLLAAAGANRNDHPALHSIGILSDPMGIGQRSLPALIPK
jgi:hypothetical protein